MTNYSNSGFTTQDKVPSTFGGARTYTIDARAAVAAADNDGKIYVLGVVTANERPTDITVQTTAITGGTDYDLGLYLINPDGTVGAVVDRDTFMDGQTMATASNVLNGFAAPAITARGGTVRELLVAAGITLNATNDFPQYYLALTGVTVGTADGTVRVIYRALKDA